MEPRVVKLDDLRDEPLVPRIIQHLTEQIAAAEKEGLSQKVESLFMDLNTIMDLALGGDVQKAIDNMEDVGALREQVLEIRDQIALAIKNDEVGKAARLRAKLWELLDAAWRERKKLKPVTHEHVSTADLAKQLK